ncbi:MAG TPA: DUF2092 domain-containing protein, partial [Phycisphaerae bacterium]|nr:DUF2092 domain-containing protein [Phycisphaerae bacterium]
MKAMLNSVVVIALTAGFFFAGCEPEKPVAAKPAASAPSPIDPQAAAVLKNMCQTLDSAKSFSCTVHQIYDSPSASGQLVQYTRKSDVLVERPDSMAVKTVGYDFEKKFWYKGKSMTILDDVSRVYARDENCPDSITGMLDFLADKYHLVMPLADLLFPQADKCMTADVTSGTYLGVHRCGKYRCHHLAFVQPNIDWQVWIDAGEKPL